MSKGDVIIYYSDEVAGITWQIEIAPLRQRRGGDGLSFNTPDAYMHSYMKFSSCSHALQSAEAWAKRFGIEITSVDVTCE